MNLRIINIALLVAFSICYLEWGKNMSTFVFQVEYDVLFRNTKDAETFGHPVILSALLGQLLLVFSAIHRIKWVNHLGVIFLSLIVFIFLLSGVLSLNLKIIASVLPFLVLAITYFVHSKRIHKKKRTGSK